MLKRLSKHKSDLARAGVVWLLLFIPLYPKFPLIRIPGSQVSLRLEDFVVMVVGLMVVWNVYPWIKNFLADRINRSIIIFWMVGLVSVVSAVFVTKTVVVHVGLLHWARRVEYMIPFFAGLLAVRKGGDLALYIKCLILVIIYAFVFGLGQKYSDWPVITTQNYEYAKGIALRFVEGGHLVSTFAGHYDMASYLILVMPMFFLLLFSDDAIDELKLFGNRRYAKGLVLMCILMGGWLSVNAASRISVVSFVGCVSVALLLIRKFKYLILFWIVGFVFISLSSNLMDRYTRILNVTVEKIVYPVKHEFLVYADGGEEKAVEDRSTSIRLNMEWPRAMRAFRKNPILGTGYSSITLATDNDYLRMLGETGILGVVAYLLVGYRIGMKLLMKIPRMFKSKMKMGLGDVVVAGVVSAIPGILLNMMFIDLLEASKFAIMFWLMLGIAVSEVQHHIYE